MIENLVDPLKERQSAMAIDADIFFRQGTMTLFDWLETGLKSSRVMLQFLQNHLPVAGVTLTVYNSSENRQTVLASLGSDDWAELKEHYNYPVEKRRWVRERMQALPDIERLGGLDRLSFEQATLLAIPIPDDVSLIRMRLDSADEKMGLLLFHSLPGEHLTEEHEGLIRLLMRPFSFVFDKILCGQELQELRQTIENEKIIFKREIMSSLDDHIIGANFGLKEVMKQVLQVAHTDSPVLLLGETGVGKEVVANALYSASQRTSMPFIKVNCGAIPEGLIDSELFGHEKGAFTGAISRKKGLFERANRGTIFLDEIGELPLSAQVRLLRVVQNQEFERVGGTETISVDVRIIAATHRNLESMVSDECFRRDLWFRLNVFPIRIPPLRDRVSDIPSLVLHFIEKKSIKMNLKRDYQPAPGAMEMLQQYSWPGNVRELENTVERSLIQANAQQSQKYLYFSWMDKPMPDEEKTDETTIMTLDQIAARQMEKALVITGGRIEGQGGAAELLDIHPATLRARMRKLGVIFGRSRIA